MNTAPKILFATDYSSSTDQALSYAASLARGMRATLLVVHVSHRRQHPVGEVSSDDSHASDEELAELAAVKPRDPFIACEHRLLFGDPAAEIIKLADQEHVNAIVVGAHHDSRLLRLLVGGVAERVLRTAHCPVISYRQSPQATAIHREDDDMHEAAASGPEEESSASPGEWDLHRTVREWTSHRSQVDRLFAAHGIDVFWDGDKPLDDVCRDKGLDPRQLADELAIILRPMYRESGADWHQATITEICDHIEATHHYYLRRELPRLGELVAKTAQAHRSEHPELEAVRTVFERVRGQLLQHVETEGTVLFPALRRLDAGDKPETENHAEPSDMIGSMKEDHEFIEADLSQLRRLTNGYSAPASASPEYRGMLGGLWELEANLNLNIHEENDILFSKALLR